MATGHLPSTSDPLVSVVIPIRNSARYLAEAVDSIAQQTYRNLEIFLVYDESSDNTLEIARGAAQGDSRITVVQNRFRGLAGALNTGLLAARGTYVARMDSDDISLAHRIERQVRYLQAHPDVAVIGTGFEVFSGAEVRLELHHPHDSIVNALHLISDSILGHPTVLIRREHALLAGGYWDDQRAEDLGLWARLAARWRVENLPFVGLRYREHGANASLVNPSALRQSADLIGRQLMVQLIGTHLGYKRIVGTTLNPRGVSRIGRLVGVLILARCAFYVRKLYRGGRSELAIGPTVRFLFGLLRGQRAHERRGL